MFRLPEIKKAISKFLTSEDGRISKKAVIGVGALIALAAAANKVQACHGIVPAHFYPWGPVAGIPDKYVLIANPTSPGVTCPAQYVDWDGHCDYYLCVGDSLPYGTNVCLWHDNAIAHKNSLNIVPKTGEIIASHAHSVIAIPVQACAYHDNS